MSSVQCGFAILLLIIRFYYVLLFDFYYPPLTASLKLPQTVAFHFTQKSTERGRQIITMPSAGLLCLLTTFIGFSLVQSKHFLLETDDNPQVTAVLGAFDNPKKAKEEYNSLSKREKRKFQKQIKKVFGGDTKAVRYTICIVVAVVITITGRL